MLEGDKQGACVNVNKRLACLNITGTMETTSTSALETLLYLSIYLSNYKDSGSRSEKTNDLPVDF